MKICEKCGGLVKRHVNQEDLVCIDCGKVYHNQKPQF
jgi:transcription initiation factor TFIIIB Brf1 subunit/transcription initiation factor TFIIB